MKESIQSELKEVMAAVQSQVSPEIVSDLLSLKEGDEGSPEYIELVDYFVKIRENSEDIPNYYVMKKDGETIKFIFDDNYPDDYAAIDEIYQDPDSALVNNWGELSVSEEFYIDKWGTFLSSYAPLKNENGQVVAMLGMDMNADKIIAKQNFIGNIVYIIIGSSIFLAIIFILFFSRTFIKDIKLLNENAKKISAGDMDIVINIRRKDEIGELASNFNIMADSIKNSEIVLKKKIKERTAELEK